MKLGFQVTWDFLELMLEIRFTVSSFQELVNGLDFQVIDARYAKVEGKECHQVL